jgi:hypothetical protein
MYFYNPVSHAIHQLAKDISGVQQVPGIEKAPAQKQNGV